VNDNTSQDQERKPQQQSGGKRNPQSFRAKRSNADGDGAMTGAAGGAVAGAVVGGPIGAAVGGVASGVIGGAASGPGPGPMVVAPAPGPVPVGPCSTRTTTRSDDAGNSVTHQTTNCPD
jgi:hypothetical protein